MNILYGKICSTPIFYIKSRLLGIQTGKGITAHGKVMLSRWPGGKISIGNNVSLISTSARATASALAFPVRLRVFGNGAEISLGDGCQLSGASITARSKTISLGKNVLLGPNVIIIDSDFHAHWPANARSTDPGYNLDAPVSIGDFAWIGMNTIILKGVKIGKGAIVGAGSVVAKDIPENCVAAGNPARIIHKADNE